MRNIDILMHIGTIALFMMLTTGRSAAGLDEAQGTFVSTAAHVREAWQLVKPTGKAIPSSSIRNAQAILAKIESKPPDSGHAVVGYIKARVAFLNGQEEGLEARFVVRMDRSIAPECILALMELHSNSGQKRLLYTQCLAELLPMSGWRRQMDGRNSVFLGDIKPPRSSVPAGNRAAMFAVAGHLQQAGLNDLAWRAYAEAVYVGFAPAWIKENLEETWVSPQAAEYWANAAECARLAGKKNLAWAYLTKAAIFGNEQLYARTQTTAHKWNAEAKAAATTKPTAPKPIDPAVKRKALTQAVWLYAQLNAHPRALALIDANRNAFENPDKLHEEMERQWLAVVKDVSRAAKKVTLYGYEVYPKGDPLKMRIPWALSDKAMTSVLKRLRPVSAQTSTTQPDEGRKESSSKTNVDTDREKQR